MKRTTDYRSLKNRCSQCGHRKAMISTDGHTSICTVVNGEPFDNTKWTPCTCKRSYASVAQ